MSNYYRTLIKQKTDLFNACIAAYKLENNGNDSHINSFNGSVGTSVTFSSTNAVDGLAGQFIANNNSGIIITDNDAFSFTTGTVDKPFAIKANIRTSNTPTNNVIFSKWNGLNSNASEYIFLTRGGTGRLAIFCYNRLAGGAWIGVETTTSICDGNPKNVIVNYNGSGTVSGFQLIVNGTVQSLNNISTGTYLSMGNTTVSPVIGNRSGGSSSYSMIGTIDELYLFNIFLNSAQIAELQNKYYPNF